MELKCVIIDDEPLAIDVINEHIEKTSYLTLFAKFTNPVKAFEFLSDNRVDVLFVDIQMPDLTGLELVRNLKHQPVVIFTTAYDQYAIEGFKVDAVDYLLKPIDYPEFLKAAEKAKQWVNSKNKIINLKIDNSFLYIKSEHKLIRIDFNTIEYIEGMSEYIRIHRENKKSIMSLLSLKNLEKELPSNLFMRIHKSYIVNLNKISEIDSNIIICSNGKSLPVSRMYKDNFQNYINKNFF